MDLIAGEQKTGHRGRTVRRGRGSYRRGNCGRHSVLLGDLLIVTGAHSKKGAGGRGCYRKGSYERHGRMGFLWGLMEGDSYR